MKKYFINLFVNVFEFLFQEAAWDVMLALSWLRWFICCGFRAVPEIHKIKTAKCDEML